MSATVGAGRPTLEEIRTWPATVSVQQAALAFGISRATMYTLIREGRSPCRTLSTSTADGRGSRILVVTESLILTLSAEGVPA